MRPLNLREIEAAARATLPNAIYDQIAGGAEDEVTVAANRRAFRRRSIRHQVLQGVIDPDLSIDLVNQHLSHPIILAPTANHRAAHPEGEAATVRGAARTGTLVTVPDGSALSLEEIATAAHGSPLWFQLDAHLDLQVGARLAKRAEAAGYTGLVVTLDTPVRGRRERDLRNDYAMDAQSFGNFPDESVESLRGMRSQARTWDDLVKIRSFTRLPFIVKGVLRGDDAALAAKLNVDAVWISNHGGRQLDSSVATLDALEGIRAATTGRCALILDGGIRRGTDALKALALGANAVAVGRPQLWALAVGGADGVHSMIQLLHDELRNAMILSGCQSIRDIRRDLVEP